MRTTIARLGWLVALGLLGCAGDAEEATTFETITFGDVTGGRDESVGESSAGHDSSTHASTDGSSDGGPTGGASSEAGSSEAGSSTAGSSDGGASSDGSSEGAAASTSDAGTTGASDAGSNSDGGGSINSSSDDGGGGGSCCEVQAGPGCQDTTVQDCVCAGDDFCCATQWDEQCVAEANVGCAAMCDGGGECCAVQAGPGCGDAAIEGCVCALDSFCCDTQWDDLCVAEANDECAASCDGSSACCMAQLGPGCGDAAIEGCVCGFDSFCCDTQWDDVCAGEAAECGAAC